MTARTGVHEVRNPIAAHVPPEFPVEGWVDPLTGRRLRREYLGSCSGGVLQIGDLPRSTRIDLFFRRLAGNPTKPRPSEVDANLRRFIAKWRSQHMRRSGKPQVARYGTNLVWLALMSLATYSVDSAPGGGSVLYRFQPVIQRPRAALVVPLAGSGSDRHVGYRNRHSLRRHDR